MSRLPYRVTVCGDEVGAYETFDEALTKYRSFKHSDGHLYNYDRCDLDFDGLTEEESDRVLGWDPPFEDPEPPITVKGWANDIRSKVNAVLASRPLDKEGP